MAKRMRLEDLMMQLAHQPTKFILRIGDQEEGFKWLTAMLNSDGRQGNVAFGMQCDGTIVGVGSRNPDEILQALRNQVQSTINPPLSCAFKTADCEGKTDVVVSARRPLHVPLYEYDRRAHVRKGTSYRTLAMVEKIALARVRPPLGIAGGRIFFLIVILLCLLGSSGLALYVLLTMSAPPNPPAVSWIPGPPLNAWWLLAVAGGMLGGCARGLWFLTLDIYGFEHRRRTGRSSAWLKQIYK